MTSVMCGIEHDVRPFQGMGYHVSGSQGDAVGFPGRCRRVARAVPSGSQGSAVGFPGRCRRVPRAVPSGSQGGAVGFPGR